MTKAILIHNPAPNAAAIIKYVADKYGLVCDDPQQIKQLIELAKLANKYAIAYRMHIVQKICQNLGVTPTKVYDSPHMFVDDDNVFHFSSQSAKGTDTPIFFDPKTGDVHIFQGLSNPQWQYSVTGAHYFTKYDKPFDIESFKQAIAPTAEYVKTLNIRKKKTPKQQ